MAHSATMKTSALELWPSATSVFSLCGRRHSVHALTIVLLDQVEDLFAKLSKGKQYSKLDLSQAYLQVPVDEETK